MDCRIFNVRTRSFLCMRILYTPGFGTPTSQHNIYILARNWCHLKKIYIVLLTQMGFEPRVFSISTPPLYQLSHPVTIMWKWLGLGKMSIHFLRKNPDLFSVLKMKTCQNTIVYENKSILLKEDWLCPSVRPSLEHGVGPFQPRGAVCVIKPCPPFNSDLVALISWLVAISWRCKKTPYL